MGLTRIDHIPHMDLSISTNIQALIVMSRHSGHDIRVILLAAAVLAAKEVVGSALVLLRLGRECQTNALLEVQPATGWPQLIVWDPL
jgi:hypothetical protein